MAEHTAIFEVTLPYPREEVFAWHETPEAFRSLMPEHAEVIAAPASLAVGEQAVLRLPLVDLPGIRELPFLRTLFVAEHTRYERGVLFEDTMRTGPFKRWRHEHQFLPWPTGTLLRDQVHYELPLSLLSELAQPIMARLLRTMFARRHEITRARVGAYVGQRTRLRAV